MNKKLLTLATVISALVVSSAAANTIEIDNEVKINGERQVIWAKIYNGKGKVCRKDRIFSNEEEKVSWACTWPKMKCCAANKISKIEIEADITINGAKPMLVIPGEEIMDDIEFEIHWDAAQQKLYYTTEER